MRLEVEAEKEKTKKKVVRGARIIKTVTGTNRKSEDGGYRIKKAQGC